MSDTSDKKDKPKSDQLELASVVAGRVSIDAILLSESRTRRTPDFGSGSEEVEYNTKIKEISFGFEREQKKIFIVPSFSFQGKTEEQSEGDESLVIEATFVLIYSLESLDGVEEKHVEAFGSTSGVYNAWPYWREFVQNTSVRMGISPLVVPVFRLKA